MDANDFGVTCGGIADITRENKRIMHELYPENNNYSEDEDGILERDDELLRKEYS
jgi:hypothetical protein